MIDLKNAYLLFIGSSILYVTGMLILINHTKDKGNKNEQ